MKSEGRRTLFKAIKMITAVITINPFKPKDLYRGRTAPLISKRCILYIYSTNIGSEYFKHGIYCPISSSKCSLFHNSNVFGSCIIHILYSVLKLEKNSGAKRLSTSLPIYNMFNKTSEESIIH
jgi:hypothetical protein